MSPTRQGTSDRAYAFIPPACKKGALDAKPCRMHLYHHGCVSKASQSIRLTQNLDCATLGDLFLRIGTRQGGPWGSVFYEGIAHHAGFNEWAEA